MKSSNEIHTEIAKELITQLEGLNKKIKEYIDSQERIVKHTRDELDRLSQNDTNEE